MQIIVEGFKFDTLDIWDIEKICTTREAKILIKVNGQKNICIGKNIPYETYTGQFQQYWQPIEKLYKELKEKWDADKSDIPVFKL